MASDRNAGAGVEGGGAEPSSEADDRSGSGGGSLISRLLGLGAGEEQQPPPPSPRARAMLGNVRRLGDLKVVDVMVPRADVMSVEIGDDLATIIDVFRRSGHSRLPVYRESLDDPLGFVHLKDLALRHGFGGANGGSFDLAPLLRPILYVPPSMPVDALLRRMQAGRMHLALVIDEYGGVDGLITIEDVLEQIVGEIEDEHDVAEDAAFREEADGSWVAAARVEVPDFEEAAGLDLLSDELDEEVDTLGGLVFMLAERVPERGEVIVHPDGHEFEVLDADPRRIKRLRVRLGAREPGGGEDDGVGGGGEDAAEAQTPRARAAE